MAKMQKKSQGVYIIHGKTLTTTKITPFLNVQLCQKRRGPILAFLNSSRLSVNRFRKILKLGLCVFRKPRLLKTHWIKNFQICCILVFA